MQRFFIFDLGAIGPKVASVYTGGYIGGAVNFLAVSQVVEMNANEFSSAISTSGIVSILALMLLLAIPSIGWINRHFSMAHSDFQESIATFIGMLVTRLPGQ